jgi:glycosyltransferase involved in cell wall biosynthesis
MRRQRMNIIVTGGFEANFVVGFAKGLAANGVEFTVVSCDATESRLADAGIPNVNLRRSLDGHRPLLAKFKNLFRYYIRLLLLLFSNRGGTVHFIGIFRNKLILWDGLILNLCFRLLAGRYLYTVHNVLPHNRERSRFYRWIYRWIYRIPHILLVHTERGREQLIQEFGVSRDRIHLTSIGLNEEMPVTSLTRSEARHRLGFEGNQQLILFFGKIDHYKGLDLLLTAFESLPFPNTRLIVAGGIRSPEFGKSIRLQLETMSRRAHVHFFERFIPNEEAEVFFKASDVLCLPYRQIYQSGLVFLGPRFGIPMISTDVGALREFIGDTLGLVTRTNNPAGLADALKEFLSAPEKFSSTEILNRGRQFQWANVCRGLVPLYHRRTRRPSSNQPAAGVASDGQQRAGNRPERQKTFS